MRFEGHALFLNQSDQSVVSPLGPILDSCSSGQPYRHSPEMCPWSFTVRLRPSKGRLQHGGGYVNLFFLESQREKNECGHHRFSIVTFVLFVILLAEEKAVPEDLQCKDLSSSALFILWIYVFCTSLAASSPTSHQKPCSSTKMSASTQRHYAEEDNGESSTAGSLQEVLMTTPLHSACIFKVNLLHTHIQW